MVSSRSAVNCAAVDSWRGTTRVSGNFEVKRANEETVQMLVRALEAKDRYTAGHAERVANYARLIGEELRFTPARLERLSGRLAHSPRTRVLGAAGEPS